MAAAAASAGVKGLVESGLRDLPEAFVSFEEPCSSEILDLPVVDLRESTENVVDAVRAACQEYGAFQLVGHCVAVSLMQSMNLLVHRFFDMPAADRMTFYSEDKSRPVRFSSSYRGGQELWYDYIYHICNPLFSKQDVPSNVSDYWEIASEYVKQMELLAKKLLQLISQGLGLPKDALEQKMQEPWHVMRMNYYPPCPEPQLALGIGAHTDSSGLTILQPDYTTQGLQVLHAEKWMHVKPMDGAFLINMGDQMEILTNGNYKSPVHRAMVNGTSARVSIATFYSPGLATFVSPMLPSQSPRYHGCRFDDYLKLYKPNVFGSEPAIKRMRKKASSLSVEDDRAQAEN